MRRAPLRSIADKTLRLEKMPSQASLAVVIVGDRSIRSYNRRFHQVDAPTDVLSFPSGEKEYIGDIIISFEMARRNARTAGWRTADELKLLVVHGILHLLGYSDETPRKRSRMWKRQAEILGRAIKS